MLLPGLWVALLTLLLGLALRRWYDPVPLRCWLAWTLALAVLFGAVLFGGRTLLSLGYLTEVPPFTHLVEGEPPGNLLQSDLVLQIAPWLTRVREAYGAGRWPLWNPLAGGGEPLLANPQSQAFQPLAWLAFPFPVVAGFGVIAALKVILALVFTWLLLTRQGISALPALAGSFAFGLGGFLQLWLGWPLSGSAAFLPLLLYAILRVEQSGERRDSVLLALATACVLLVGHPETGLHVALLAAAFTLSRLLAVPAGRRLRLAGAWALAVALGSALAAPVVLPAAEYLPHSLRVSLLDARHERLQAAGDGRSTNIDGEPPSSVARRHDPLARLIPNAAPNAFGNNRFGGYWGDRNIVEDAAGFAGTAALLAALAAVWPLAAGRRFPQERLMLGVALVCLVIAVRPPGMVRVLEALPVLRHSLNFHSRVTLLLDLAVAYLAACTWERWRRGELALRRLLLPAAALSAAIAWAYLANPGPDPAAFARLRLGSLALQLATLAAALLLMAFRSTPWRAAGLAAVAAAELVALHGPAHPPVPAELYYPVLPPIALIQERLDPWHRMSGLGPALRPNFASVYGVADPRTSNPAKPAGFVAAIRRIDAFPGRATDGFVAPEDPLYQLLGVRFLITVPRTFLPKPYRLVSRGGGAWVYQNRLALPLFFLPAAVQPCPAVTSWSDCTAGIPDFASLAAVHASPLPIAGWAAVHPEASALDLGAVRPDHLHARARLAEPRLLASSIYQDGNWKLLVGGIPHRTTLANGPFVAAWLPAGKPEDLDLDLLYRPGSVVAGLAVAALALAVGAGLWGAPQTARRSQARSAGSE
jgi:hypothetical protein